MNVCKCCKKEFKVSRNCKGLYCSNKCQIEQQYLEYIIKWKLGNVTGTKGKTLSLSNHIRRYMLEKENCTCEKCGWNNTHPNDGRPLVEIDHIDGNASNTTENNLRVLCPNCHSMTHTFRARNKNSARNR